MLTNVFDNFALFEKEPNDRTNKKLKQDSSGWLLVATMFKKRWPSLPPY